MPSPSSSGEPSPVHRFDFDALYRGDSPAEGIPAMTTPPWDNKAPKDTVVAWQATVEKHLRTRGSAGGPLDRKCKH